jgi:D-arabinose 1-dehydrogenase-like Zn-dependent alcohol dehydrogenase
MVEIPEKSKAAVLVDFGKPLEIRELPIPQVEPRGILVKVEMAGVCGTDIHQWKGDMGKRVQPPLVPGHETVGKIIKLGEGRSCDCAGEPLKEGDRIMWAHVDCGECHSCKVLKQSTLCEHRFGYGYYDSLTGSFAEYEYVLPKADVVKIPEGLTNEEVVGVCCAFRTAVGAFERLPGLGMQSTVVVQGVGPVGLYSIVLSKIGGAGKIIAIGAPSVRLNLAKKWGADEVINIEEIPDAAKRNEKILSSTYGRGADLVVEASGVPIAFGEGLDMLRRGGRYLVIGQTSPRGIIKMSPAAIVWKNLEIIGQCGADISHYYKALQIIKNNRQRFSFGDIITHQYSLKDINFAYASMVAGTDIKPAIVP